MIPSNPNSVSLNFTHRWHIQDLRSPEPITTEIPLDSISGYLKSDPNFCKFFEILNRSGSLLRFADKQNRSTLFITPDIYLQDLDLNRIDRSQAIDIIQAATLPRLVTCYDIQNPSYQQLWNDIGDRILALTHNGRTLLNDKYVLLESDIVMNNGIIHIINGMLEPRRCNLV